MLRQYTVKHYSGLSSERPETLPFGDFYFEEDTGQLYKYGQDNLAKPTSKLSEESLGEVVDIVQGWQDFADLTTQATPIEQISVDGGQVQLTTDNAGTLTDGNTTQNSETTLGGVNDIWNTSSNTIQFGGTGLITNDTIDARIHFEISPNIVPQNFKLVFEFYDDINGGGNKVFELVSAVQSVFENAGTFVEMLIERRFFIGESIKDGSAIVKLEGSSSFEVKMKGFNFEIRR